MDPVKALAAVFLASASLLALSVAKTIRQHRAARRDGCRCILSVFGSSFLRRNCPVHGRGA